MNNIKRKLDNENFVNKAPENVVKNEKDKYERYLNDYNKFKSNFDSFKIKLIRLDNHKFYKINLNTEIQFLKGVGPKRGSVLNSFGIDTIQNLIRHFPRKYLDRTNIKHIKDLQIGEQAVIIGHIKSFGLKRLKEENIFN